MSIKENIQKAKSIISRIEETIIPLQEKKLWNDDKFFEDVNNFLRNGIINEDEISRIVANALFRLTDSKPDVEVVKSLIKAFPNGLKCKNKFGDMPIEHLGKSQHWTQYVLPLALEGSKHGIGGEGTGGGLRCGIKNTLIQLSGADECCLNTLKDLREHNLFLKSDIETYALLKWSCFSHYSSVFEYLVQWHPEALRSTTVKIAPFSKLPLVHYIISIGDDTDNRYRERFVRFFSISMKYYKNILFQKDKQNGQTAFERALKKFGEKKTMSLLREVITEEARYPLLQIVHQPKYYNLFLAWFPFLYNLLDDKGRAITQVMPSFLKANPTFWINLRTDQFEEKDPGTSLRPFAAAAVGNDNDLNLSYQILRQHPSVIDVILEQREKEKEKKDRKRQKRKQENNLARLEDVQKKLKF